MGGIVGIKSKGDLKEVSYRGPDAKECTHANGWALGHARLSVLDKTRGSQPMSDPVHKSHIVHSGEIYNFRELRKELGGKFKTDTDAEVILRLHAGG
jgi:asparagine synthase (glutamine-hydrolysing)